MPAIMKVRHLEVTTAEVMRIQQALTYFCSRFEDDADMAASVLSMNRIKSRLHDLLLPTVHAAPLQVSALSPRDPRAPQELPGRDEGARREVA